MWDESQTKNSINRTFPHIVENHIVYDINKCYIDGAWREQDSCTGQWWVYKKGGSTDTMVGAMLFARVYHLYILNVKLWYEWWSAWRPYKSQKWCLQLTTLNRWRWCLHQQNDRRSLHTRRSLCDVKIFFIPLLFNIFRGRKKHWRISWHEVLGISFLL